jgi:hypothetical protein
MPQGFGWDACEKGGWWNQLKDKIPDVASAGVSHIWLPPPSESVAPQVAAATWHANCSPAGAVAALMAETCTRASQGYLPGQLYNLNSKFGNQEELKALVAACKEAGVRPLCELCMLDQPMLPHVVPCCQADKLSMDEYVPHIFWSPCCKHCQLTRGSFEQATLLSIIGVRTPRTSMASGTNSGGETCRHFEEEHTHRHWTLQ